MTIDKDVFCHSMCDMLKKENVSYSSQYKCRPETPDRALSNGLWQRTLKKLRTLKKVFKVR